MIQQEKDLEFNFSDALQVIKFDDKDHALSHCMKAVDFIVEFPTAYVFVEVKDPSHPKAKQEKVDKFRDDATSGKLRDDIVKKFRDSFLYRWAENKVDKPIHFIALITFEEALLNNFQTILQKQLPMKGSLRWSKKIAESCLVINIETWNRNFPKWPVRRISAAS